MNIENIAIKDIKPYERNAKKHDETQIKNVMESIKQFGFAQPLVVDKDNVLIIGHCRLIAAKRLKLKEVPVVRMDELTQEQVDKLRLLDNKLNESEWDFDLLAEDIPTLDFSDFDIDWDLPEDILEENTEVEEDDAPEPPAEPKAKSGDLYILGNHRLICGDSTDVAVIDRLMDGVKADMVFTDPPYALVGNSTGLGSATDDMLKPFFLAIFQNICRFTRDLMHVYVCCDWKSCNAILTEAKKTQLTEKSLIVWDKESIGLGSPYMSQYELIWFFENHKQKTMQAGKTEYKNRRNIKGKSNVWKFKRVQEREHNAQKPVELVAEALSNSSFENEIVLDLFGGSGSTLIACEQLNRKCYMCELDPHYIDVIIQRYINFKGTDKDVFLIRDGKKIPYNEVE